jgi:thiol-disulfide isomerase/thioredoxin
MKVKNIGNFVLVLILMMGVNLVGEYVRAKNFSILYTSSICMEKGVEDEVLICKGNSRIAQPVRMYGNPPHCLGAYRHTPLHINGTIKNFANQILYLYKCYQDTLLIIDSTKTDNYGKFQFSVVGIIHELSLQHGLPQHKNNDYPFGLYKIYLKYNQYFYIINDNQPVEIKTVYQFHAFENIATDSLVVIKSDENKRFYQFQRLQKQINVARYFLLEMMRLYPIYDPFHKELVKEYFKRYEAMEKFVKSTVIATQREAKGKQSHHSLANLIIKAYYEPINPDWKEPDPWRDSILAAHYFDYFNPAEKFYLHTNILPEKMDIYLNLRTNKRDAYNQPIRDEKLFSDAAIDFVRKTMSNYDTYEFCLNYFLKRFNKEHKEVAFLNLYDAFLQNQEGDCGSSHQDAFTWAREKANVYRNVQIGSAAPDFSLQDGLLNLSSIQSDYILLVFWASWCPHCVEEIPKIKAVTDSISLSLQKKNKKLITIAISLDTDKEAWQKYVKEKNLLSWLNTSELKGWKGEISKKYNVYATPTMFVLDKDKKIIAKPILPEQLAKFFNNKNEIESK